MTLEELVSKYITSASHVFSQMRVVETSISIDLNAAKNVVEIARTYLEDAKYYEDGKRFDVSLACVAYCEGLLDALKLLGVVKVDS